MNRMTDKSGTAVCTIVAVLLLAAFAPTESGAASIDAVAFEVNRPDMQVIVWMPLRTAGCIYRQDDAHMYLVCDVHLGKSGVHAGRKMLKQDLLITERYTMLLTVTGEDLPPKQATARVRVSTDLDATAILRSFATKVARGYSRVAAFFLRALFTVIRDQIS